MDNDIKKKLNAYPIEARQKLTELRQLILDVAAEEELSEVTEQLKWGELSYTSKHGSPIRIDWKAKFPDQVSLFVNCKTLLIETFKEVYGDQFQYVGNREIVLSLSQPLPQAELKACISMALQYHKLKKLPLLGA